MKLNEGETRVLNYLRSWRGLRPSFAARRALASEMSGLSGQEITSQRLMEIWDIILREREIRKNDTQNKTTSIKDSWINNIIKIPQLKFEIKTLEADKENIVPITSMNVKCHGMVRKSLTDKIYTHENIHESTGDIEFMAIPDNQPAEDYYIECSHDISLRPLFEKLLMYTPRDNDGTILSFSPENSKTFINNLTLPHEDTMSCPLCQKKQHLKIFLRL